LKIALETKDAKIVANCVSFGLKRNFAGICNKELYRYSNLGTKRLIEEYISMVTNCLDFILQSDNKKISLLKKYKKFKYMRQSFGGTALMLS
jgi:TAG lipase / steryl ester hydrolase / phospholipase A2 / LPA acyltransferase